MSRRLTDDIQHIYHEVMCRDSPLIEDYCYFILDYCKYCVG